MDDQSIAAVASGSPEGGFIVDMHDGEHHHVHLSHAKSQEDAETEGRKAFEKRFREREKAGAQADDETADLKEVSAMREEIKDLKDAVARLEASVSELQKNRDRLKSADDKQAESDIKDLTSRISKASDSVDRQRKNAEAAAAAQKPDAHGRMPGEHAAETAATGKATGFTEPEARQLPNEAERNAEEAAALGTENKENPGASANNATYAARHDELHALEPEPQHDRPLADLSAKENKLDEKGHANG